MPAWSWPGRSRLLLGYTGGGEQRTGSLARASASPYAAEREGIIGAKLFVGNLNFQTTRDELSELFSEVGELVDVFLPLDRATGKPRGFGFVEYADPADAKEAVEKFDGHELGGRALRVNEAADRPPRAPRPPRFQGGGPPQGGDGGFYGPSDRPSRPKGSRRNARGKKRSL
mgnify:FL=1